MESNLESNMKSVIKEISEFFIKFKCLNIENYANIEVSTCSNNVDTTIKVDFYIDSKLDIKSHSMGFGKDKVERFNWYGFFYQLNDKNQCESASKLINKFIDELGVISKSGEA